jgi:hypothetical protein
MADLIWEMVNSGDELFVCKRAKVPGGWIVRVGERRYEVGDDEGIGLTFVPDPNHAWV